MAVLAREMTGDAPGLAGMGSGGSGSLLYSSLEALGLGAGGGQGGQGAQGASASGSKHGVLPGAPSFGGACASDDEDVLDRCASLFFCLLQPSPRRVVATPHRAPFTRFSIN